MPRQCRFVAEVVSELRLKTTRRPHCVWVKGHATKIHIDRGTPRRWRKGRNDAADVPAFAAAAHHAAPQALAGVVTKRQLAALTIHAFVAALLFERRDVLLAMSEADRC